MTRKSPARPEDAAVEEGVEANFFRDQRLADIYDALGSEDRPDLDPYLAIVEELGAMRIVDLGSGTGTFACRLAGQGKEVVAVEPAEASVNVARRKPSADRVRWIVGDAAAIPSGAGVDLVTMSGNVPEHLADEQWADTLAACHRALRPGGHLVFGNRDIEKQSWFRSPEFAPRSAPGSENHGTRVESTPEGPVHHWLEVLEVTPEDFSFRWTYRFERDGAELTWETTFRLRSVDEVRAALGDAGFTLVDIRDSEGGHDGNEIFIASR